MSELAGLPAPNYPAKIANAAEALARIGRLPRPVVFTNGVFDILHRGHVMYLAQARALGASLVVALNTDASARRLGKGPDRVRERLEAAFGFRTDSLVDGCARRVGSLLCHGYKALGAQWCAACAIRSSPTD